MSFIPQKGNFITLDPRSKAAVASDVMGYVYQIKDVKTDFVTVSVVGKVANGSESDHKLLVVHSSTKSNLPKFFYFKDYQMNPYKGIGCIYQFYGFTPSHLLDDLLRCFGRVFF